MRNREIALKIKNLREIHGYTQAEMADKTGLSRMAYNTIENGRSLPRSSNLYRISKALNVKIQDLLEPVPDMSEVRFRCKKCRTPKERNIREQLLIKIKLWLVNFCKIEELMDEKAQFRFPLKDGWSKNLVEASLKAREKFGLGETEPVNDICGLVESKSIRLYFFEANDHKFSGLSLIHKKKYPAIAVNISSDISVERRIFTVAHELGHLLLHRNSFDVNETAEIELQENQANIFAGYFLMPDRAFEAKLEENKGLNWVDSVLDIKRYFKVSYMTVLKRLIDKKITDEHIYVNFAIQYKKRYDHDLKNHYEPFGLEKVDFLEVRLNRLVREALEKEIITIGRAADILGVSMEEMMEKGRNWSPPDEKENSPD